jgi:hypothetical protein
VPFQNGALKPESIQVRIHLVLKVLGTVEPSSPEPRRNTSKSFFEISVSGDKADTSLQFAIAYLL